MFLHTGVWVDQGSHIAIGMGVDHHRNLARVRFRFHCEISVVEVGRYLRHICVLTIPEITECSVHRLHMGLSLSRSRGAASSLSWTIAAWVLSFDIQRS